MSDFLVWAAPYRRFCESASLGLFVFFWPIANLYWLVAFFLGDAGKALGAGSELGEVLGAVSVIMAFMAPLWAVAVFLAFYLSAALAVLSFRPVPLLLLAVAWLSLYGPLPSGHIGLGDFQKFHGGNFEYFYPVLYSVLTILGCMAAALARKQRASVA